MLLACIWHFFFLSWFVFLLTWLQFLNSLFYNRLSTLDEYINPLHLPHSNLNFHDWYIIIFVVLIPPCVSQHGCHFYFLKIRYMWIDQSEIPLRVWKIAIWLNIHLKYHIFMCFQPFWREIIQRNSACSGLCADWQYDRSAKILNNPLYEEFRPNMTAMFHSLSFWHSY